MNDWELLQEYARRKSESAFSTLVARHTGLVYAAALRQTNNATLAEDVTQTVFLLLSRKAASFRQNVILPGWLFRTTHFVASRARRSEQRRQHREQKTFMKESPHAANNDASSTIVPLLDEAMIKLSETDRSALILRYFQEKSLQEVGAALGLSEEAARKRVGRALDKLRSALGKRGCPAATGAILAALSATAAASPDLSAKIASYVWNQGATGAASSLSQLTRDTLDALRIAQWKAAGAWVGTAALALLALFVAGRATFFQPSTSGPAAEEPAIATMATASPPSGNMVVDAGAFVRSSGRFVMLRVIDDTTGQGIAKATVPASFVIDGEWTQRYDLVTDAEGNCDVPLPQGTLSRMDVGGWKNGFVPKFMTWRGDGDEPLPLTQTLALEQAVSIGGRVVRRNGEPVPNAKIEIFFADIGDATFREPQRERLGFVREFIAAVTDNAGRWTCSLTPANYGKFGLYVKHPEVQPIAFSTDQMSDHETETRLAMSELWAGTAVLQVKDGFQLAGVVRDREGRPVAGASVNTYVAARFPKDTATTDIMGHFVLHGLAGGPTHVAASAKEYFTHSQWIEVRAGMPPLEFHLTNGVPFEVKIVDEESNPIEGAHVTASASGWHTDDRSALSDRNGIAHFMSIPTNVWGSLQFHVNAKGFFTSLNIPIERLGAEREIRLTRSLRVFGFVTDSETGEPIPSFKAIPCSGEMSSSYVYGERKLGRKGNYALSFSDLIYPLRVRIEAEGYEPAMSPPIEFDRFAKERDFRQDFQLVKPDPNQIIRGVVLLPDGQPALGAQVSFGSFEKGLPVLGKVQFLSRNTDIPVETANVRGEFRFKVTPDIHTIFAAHASGYGKARLKPGASNVVVRLQPWGKIEGTVRTMDGSWANRSIVIVPGTPAGFSETEPALDSQAFSATSDADGRFVIDWLPAGSFTLYLNPGIGLPMSHTTPCHVQPGMAQQVQMGGNGRRVSGKLSFPEHENVPWVNRVLRSSMQRIVEKPAAEPPRRNPINIEQSHRRIDFLESSAEWHTWGMSQRSYPVSISTDGSFFIEDVEPGTYRLQVDIADGPIRKGDWHTLLGRKRIASVEQEIVVPPPTEGGENTLDLGVLQPMSTDQATKRD